jgi:hypothetical protein
MVQVVLFRDAFGTSVPYTTPYAFWSTTASMIRMGERMIRAVERIRRWSSRLIMPC